MCMSRCEESTWVREPHQGCNFEAALPDQIPDHLLSAHGVDNQHDHEIARCFLTFFRTQKHSTQRTAHLGSIYCFGCTFLLKTFAKINPFLRRSRCLPAGGSRWPENSKLTNRHVANDRRDRSRPWPCALYISDCVSHPTPDIVARLAPVNYNEYYNPYPSTIQNSGIALPYYGPSVPYHSNEPLSKTNDYEAQPRDKEPETKAHGP